MPTFSEVIAGAHTVLNTDITGVSSYVSSGVYVDKAVTMDQLKAYLVNNVETEDGDSFNIE